MELHKNREEKDEKIFTLTKRGGGENKLVSQGFRRLGFTLSEVVIVMLIIAIVAGVCIKITRTKLDKVVTYTYYAAYETLNSVSANLIGNSYSIKKQDTEYKEGTCSTEKQCPDGYAFDKSVCDCVSISVTLPTNGNDFCEAVEESVNTVSSNCSGNNKSAISQAVASKDFSGVTPDIVLRNGMKLYNVKNDYVEIPQLKGNMKTGSDPSIKFANIFNTLSTAYSKLNTKVTEFITNNSLIPAAQAIPTLCRVMTCNPGYVYNQSTCRCESICVPPAYWNHLYNRCENTCNKSCGSNCSSCDKCTGKCNSCNSGYQLSGGSCVACNKSCSAGCSNCNKCTGQCNSCSGDYNLVNGSCVKKTCNSSAISTCTSSGGTMTSYPDCKCTNCPAGYASDGSQCKELTCATNTVNACVSSHGMMSTYLEGCLCKCEEPYESTGANTCRRKTCNADSISQCVDSGGNMTDYPDCGCYCPAGMFLADGKCVTMDEGGYIVYVDVNGNSGDSILYEDVFPFYLTLSGTVVPGFPEDGSERGGNSKSDLEVSLQYDDYSGQVRIVKWLLKSTSFREAACKSGYIQTSAYCGGMTIDDKCKVQDADCRLVPIRPIKM